MYFLNPENTFSPFAGFSVGTIYTDRTTDMGLYRWKDDTWSMSVRPEIGMLCNFNAFAAAKFSIRYNEAFKNVGMKDQSFISFNLGLIFKD